MSDTATENSTTLRFFADWLDAGGARVGQIAILPRGTDGDGRAKERHWFIVARDGDRLLHLLFGVE